jgi:hypothetical protein
VIAHIWGLPVEELFMPVLYAGGVVWVAIRGVSSRLGRSK